MLIEIDALEPKRHTPLVFFMYRERKKGVSTCVCVCVLLLKCVCECVLPSLCHERALECREFVFIDIRENRISGRGLNDVYTYIYISSRSRPELVLERLYIYIYKHIYIAASYIYICIYLED